MKLGKVIRQAAWLAGWGLRLAGWQAALAGWLGSALAAWLAIWLGQKAAEKRNFHGRKGVPIVFFQSGGLLL